MVPWCPQTPCVSPLARLVLILLLGSSMGARLTNLIANDFKMGPCLLSTECIGGEQPKYSTLGGIHPENTRWRGGNSALTWGTVDLLHSKALVPSPSLVEGALARASIHPTCRSSSGGAAPQNPESRLGVGLLESSLHRVAFCLGLSLWFHFDMTTPHPSHSTGCLCCLFSFIFFLGGEGRDFVN